ncbi:remorin 1.4-like [Prunus dulcis]|uniref:remorin 1.4-like n=1 Tax=Prunus dulcis TaxID=3755 RepID=UPI001482D882|nr:remorin 1.4-like [Prunus dulcis]
MQLRVENKKVEERKHGDCISYFVHILHLTCKFLDHTVVPESAYPAVKKDITGGGSTERDALYAQIETGKRLALIKAWEESEKTKAENKAYRRMSTVELWEDSKRTSVEAELKKIEQCPRVEETAAKFCSPGITLKKLLLGCFISQHSAIM